MVLSMFALRTRGKRGGIELASRGYATTAIEIELRP